ncbi:hypothetical protein Ciccas_007803 [Cichlidogyrus casuarinus]|uniref:Ion transport domain-containing protein n=1 Tax=Cichlidogyrus casuarinus TaxID=1844966 RepID=A0ABD2Q2H8_9PLAT
MLFLLITNLIVLPVAISFSNFDAPDNSAHWTGFNFFSDTIFLLDIVVNFRTGIITNDYVDEIILDPRQIANRYIHSWFFLDLISSVPIDYISHILYILSASNTTTTDSSISSNSSSYKDAGELS